MLIASLLLSRNSYYLYLDIILTCKIQLPSGISDNLYGDVSGLPDPYMGQPGGDPMMMQQPPPQQQQQHQYHGHQMPPPPPPGGAMGGGQFDDSQDENDFSPNGKSRRIIREIIV